MLPISTPANYSFTAINANPVFTFYLNGTAVTQYGSNGAYISTLGTFDAAQSNCTDRVRCVASAPKLRLGCSSAMRSATTNPLRVDPCSSCACLPSQPVAVLYKWRILRSCVF